MAAAVMSCMRIMQKEHMQLIIIPMKNMSTTTVMNNSVVTSITITGQRI
jgi:pantoate kinase